MKFYLSLALLVNGHAFAQQPTIVPPAEAVQAIQLPPTQLQDLRQINAGHEVAQAQPVAVQQVAAVTPHTDTLQNLDTTAPTTTETLQLENAASTPSVANELSVPPIELNAEKAISNDIISAPTQSATDHLIQQGLIACGAVVGVAVLGLMLVRMKKRGGLGFNKNEPQMEVISQLTLSPKRKIILVRIRDQEIALASTEAGITMLTDLGQSQARPKAFPQANEPRRIAAKTAPVPEIEHDDSSNRKSDLFASAFKNLKAKATANAQKEEQAPTKETAKAGPALSQTRGAFPKYLANAFQQESNRKVGGDDENLENVTNMIREKLKNIKQDAV